MQSEYRKSKKTFVILVIILSVLIVILFFVSMSVGRYRIPFSDVIKYFTGQTIPELSTRVITYLRLPRTLLAALVGCALAVSGAIYQSAFNNKLVSPDLLGVSSGASVGACFAILFGLSGVFISLFSFAMGFLAVILTVLIAKIFKNKSLVIDMAKSLSESDFVLRELAAEEVRKEKYSDYPSRLNCMFLSEKREVALENLKTFYQKGFGTHFQAIAVKLEGRLFYARSKGLQRNGSSYGEYLRIADEYWSQDQNSTEEVKEILFEGKAEVVEIMEEYKIER